MTVVPYEASIEVRESQKALQLFSGFGDRPLHHRFCFSRIGLVMSPLKHKSQERYRRDMKLAFLLFNKQLVLLESPGNSFDLFHMFSLIV